MESKQQQPDEGFVKWFLTMEDLKWTRRLVAAYTVSLGIGLGAMAIKKCTSDEVASTLQGKQPDEAPNNRFPKFPSAN